MVTISKLSIYGVREYPVLDRQNSISLSPHPPSLRNYLLMVYRVSNALKGFGLSGYKSWPANISDRDSKSHRCLMQRLSKLGIM